MDGPRITQVSRSLPFDNSTGKGYSAGNAQDALEELRDHTVYDSQTQATTLNGTLTLSAANTNCQILTGSAMGYSVQLPDATTIPLSSFYQIINTSTQTVLIKNGAGTTLFTLGQESIASIYLQLNGTVAGSWVYFQNLVTPVNVGIINYYVSSTTSFATNSTTDVVITDFAVTPVAGTYMIWSNGEGKLSNSSAVATFTVDKDGVAITDSVRSVSSPGGGASFIWSSNTIAQVDGSQAIDVRVRTTAGTLTVLNRSILMIRLGV